MGGGGVGSVGLVRWWGPGVVGVADKALCSDLSTSHLDR